MPSGLVVQGSLLRAVCCLVLLSGLVVWPCLLVSSWPRSSIFSKEATTQGTDPKTGCFEGEATTQGPIFEQVRQLQFSMAVVLVGLACASASPYSLPVSFLLVLPWSSSQFWHFQRMATISSYQSSFECMLFTTRTLKFTTPTYLCHQSTIFGGIRYGVAHDAVETQKQLVQGVPPEEVQENAKCDIDATVQVSLVQLQHELLR